MTNRSYVRCAAPDCPDPTRPHSARGFCRQCYYRVYAPTQVAVCKECGQQKHLQAKGKCAACYKRTTSRPNVVCSACGETREHAAKGMCSICYMRTKAPGYVAQRRAKWHATPMPERQKRNRTSNLKYKYGLTHDQHAEMLEAQGGTCAVCPAPASHVDHCHTTGKVRGLLCRACNVTLGNMQDDPERLRRAAEYLIRSRE